MQDKLKEILKKASIFTTDPDKDWRRLFTSLICITLITFVWSIFFYMGIKQEIIDSESAGRKSIVGGSGEREDELRNQVSKFETKKQKNDGIINGTIQSSVLSLSDPAR